VIRTGEKGGTVQALERRRSKINDGREGIKAGEKMQGLRRRYSS